MRKLVAATLVAAGLCACGGDDAVSPEIIVGGGVRDPGIDGTVNVYVIDEDDDQPITGAAVRVGDVEGTTDATGLFVAKDGALKGKQTIAVRATSYASSVWVGVDGANVTVPLTRAMTTTTAVPQAELGGTIAGWDALPTPATGHLLAAFVIYSQRRDLGDDEGNNLEPPPTATGQLPANVCARGPGGQAPPCAWRINARTGTVAVMAVIVDIDSKNTPEEDDDVVTPIGFAIKHPITVADGADQTGITLDQIPGTPTTASVSFGTPPAGLSRVAGVVGIDLGDAGVLRPFLLAASPTTSMVTVPSLSSLAGASYEFLGIASEPIDDGTAGQSIVLRRGITSASGIAAGEWLAPPTGLASDRAMVSLTPATGADLTILEIDTSSGSGDGNRAMSIAIFDGTTTVALPVDFAPLPGGALTVTANGFAAEGFTANDFEVEALVDSVTQLASETIKLN